MNLLYFEREILIVCYVINYFLAGCLFAEGAYNLMKVILNG